MDSRARRRPAASPGRFFNTRGDLTGSGRLLFDGSRDRLLHPANPPDNGGYFRHRIGDVPHLNAHRPDAGVDLRGEFGSGAGQIPHFVGYDGETGAELARVRRFDGGVQSQKVGLERDGADHLGGLGDTGAGLMEAGNRGCRRIDQARGSAADFGRLRGTRLDTVDAGLHAPGARGHHFHVAGHHFAGVSETARGDAKGVGVGGHAAHHAVHLLRVSPSSFLGCQNAPAHLTPYGRTGRERGQCNQTHKE